MNLRSSAIVNPQIAIGICIAFSVPALLAEGFALGTPAVPAGSESPLPFVVNQFCADCHNGDEKKGGLDLESGNVNDVAGQTQVWEKVVRRLRARQMPPAGKKRPDESTYKAVLARLESLLDNAAAAHPNPGRTDTLRRLNRTEYQNAVRDLLALDINAAALLPKDEGSHGFDNITVENLSPTLLDRYISAAQKISRMAIGAPRRIGGDTIRIRPDVTQEGHVEGLPIGTRGGALIPYTFPQDAEYEIQIRLNGIAMKRSKACAKRMIWSCSSIGSK